MDKSEIIKSIVKKLEVNLEGAIAEAQSAKEAATGEESKAENKYDTRGLEASYIAQAQSARTSKIKEEIFNLSKVDLTKRDKVSIGSLVEVFYTEQDKTSFYFLLPSGGVLVDYKKINVQTLSVESPLGKTLFQKTLEDSILFRKEELELVAIH